MNTFFGNGLRVQGSRRDTPRLRILLSAMVCGLLALAGSVIAATPAQAQPTDRVIYSLGLLSNDARMGQSNAGAVRGSDGTVYFAASGQLNDGNVLSSIAPNGTYTALHWFNRGQVPDAGGARVADGAAPLGTPIIDASGILYGTTAIGGTGGVGAVFQYRTTGTNAGQYSLLYSWPANGAMGNGPRTGLVEGSDGNLYGTTFGGGGASDRGTVFRLTKAGVLTVLMNFSTPADALLGLHPQGRLTQGADGAFYGTTGEGGATNNGTVFRVTTAGAFTQLAQFDGNNGRNPVGDLALGTDGNLYGTTAFGGGTNTTFGVGANGTVFRVGAAGSLTTLYRFFGDSRIDPNTLGIQPLAGLVRAADGNFYGATVGGGGPNSRGTVFRVTTLGAVTQLFGFPTTFLEGVDPTATLTLGADGFLYGTTTAGGRVPGGTFIDQPNETASGFGTVFRIGTDGTFTRLLTATSQPTEGRSPSGALVQATDGNFYGVTVDDAKRHGGTIFRLTPGGVLSTLHVLNPGSAPREGLAPEAGLTIGPDGNFYGTVSTGGAGFGSVFSMTPAGAYTQLYSFSGGADGQYPFTSLTLGADGNFYGVTERGGANNFGVIFRITPAGNFLKIFDFDSTRGSLPRGKLLLAGDGNFYGTAQQGGTSGNGTVFRLTPAGTVTLLYSFLVNQTDGRLPFAGLVQGIDGALYGTTSAGGASNGNGTVFRITTAGAYSLLHTFDDTTGGRRPLSPLLLARDGNFYGTTTAINFNDVTRGLIYRLTPQGQYSIVYQLAGFPDGAGIEDEVIQATDGDLYAPTRGGGAFGFGSVIAVSGPADRITNLSGSPTVQSAVLSWSTVPRAVTYNIYRATTAGGEGATPIATGITAAGLTGGYTATGLTAGTPYFFTVTAVNTMGETQFSNEVSVTPAAPVSPAPTVTIAANPTTITLGASTALNWSSTNATTCTASGAWSGAQATNGNQSLTPAATGNAAYTLTCTGPGGSGNATATVTVNAVPPPPAPTVTISANPTTITLGANSTLSWSSTSAAACTASGAWAGNKAINGTESVTPTATGNATYTLTCTGSGGSGNATATVTVNPVAVPPPTVTIAANPTTITLGASSTLTWSSTNATGCTASGGWSGAKAVSGTENATPTAIGSAVYTLTCTGSGGTSNALVTLTVNPATSTPPPGSKSGGGAFGWLWLLFGSAAAALRKHRGTGR